MDHQLSEFAFLTITDDAEPPAPDDAAVLTLAVSLQLAEGLSVQSARFLAIWNVGQERLRKARWSVEEWKMAIDTIRRAQ